MTCWRRDATRAAGPYGYVVVDGGPHPNSRKAAEGYRLRMLAADEPSAESYGGCSLSTSTARATGLQGLSASNRIMINLTKITCIMPI